MRLEFQNIAGEDVAFIVIDCTECGGGIALQERDIKTTKPVHCSNCNHSRYLSYREYILITDRFAAQLLKHAVAKFGGIRKSGGCRPLPLI